MNELYSIDDINDRCPTKIKFPVRDRCLPKSISLLGLVMQVKSIKMVGWKEEIILTLSNACDTCIEISFWKNHDAPKFANVNDLSLFKGGIALIKRVQVKTHDYMDGYRTYYSEVLQRSPRWVQILIVDASHIENFLSENQPLKTDLYLSDIPKNAANKTAGKQFPNWDMEKCILKTVLRHLAKFLDASENKLFENEIDFMKRGYLEWLREHRPLEFVKKTDIEGKLKKWLAMEEVF